MPTFAQKVIKFNKSLKFTGKLPEGIRVMNPFSESGQVVNIMSAFYNKFYNDNRTRRIILGINPGRFGGGVTGIPFTDTKRLTQECGLEIQGMKTHEPSSVFVYEIINAYGGVDKFYSDYYINSVCPLGFTSTLKGTEINYNYYDNKELMQASYDFIVQSIRSQIKFGIETDTCFCLGTGKNFDFLNKLNQKEKFFGKVVPLSHPRFVMQYRAKRKQEYIDDYIKKLTS